MTLETPLGDVLGGVFAITYGIFANFTLQATSESPFRNRECSHSQ